MSPRAFGPQMAAFDSFAHLVAQLQTAAFLHHPSLHHDTSHDLKISSETLSGRGSEEGREVERSECQALRGTLFWAGVWVHKRQAGTN